ITILRKNKIIIAILAVIVSTVLIFREELKILYYTNDMKEFFADGFFNFIILNIKGHLTELTEIFLNASYYKVIGFIPQEVAGALFIIVGAGLVLLLFASVF